MRYYLVDRIEEIKPFGHAEGVKAVSLSEDCFEQHFPGQPVYPGALQIEAMAQLGGALMELSMRGQRSPCPRCILSSVKAKFRDFVRPGDQLRLRAEVVSFKEDSALVQAHGMRQDRVVCEARLLYTLMVIDDARLTESRNAFLDLVSAGARWVAGE